MGYTHYWTQTRAFKAAEWREVSTDIGRILAYAQTEASILLADGMGDVGTQPTFRLNSIAFNGSGDDDAHETFTINRKRVKERKGDILGGAFCKTAGKPYDAVVTACLCYLSSVTGTHDVSSDGNGKDFLAGLDLAKAGLPEKANILDIPMGIMQDDRWTGPWVSGQNGSGYRVRFCVDGYGYVERLVPHAWCRFGTHIELAQFLDAHKKAGGFGGGRPASGIYGPEEPNIWAAMGSFDSRRHLRIAKAQSAVLATLFPVAPERDAAPPAYVRPGDYVRPEDGGTFAYRISDLLAREAA